MFFGALINEIRSRSDLKLKPRVEEITSELARPKATRRKAAEINGSRFIQSFRR